MPEREDVFDSFEAAIRARPEGNPWQRVAGGDETSYLPDYELLEQLVGIPIAEGRASESGRLAKAIDAWVASELRRCGFGADGVWPRLTKPRVLSRELALLLDGLPQQLRQTVEERLLRNKKAAPSDAKVLGRAYVKQVDVVIAHWSRGPELLISTKSMVSSFRNNLPNRFEESYGDAKNLRGRHPLVSMGFFFLLRSTVLDEPGTFERAVDMLHKLQDESDGYDACGLVVAEWSDDAFDGVTLRLDAVPSELSIDRFVRLLVARVLERTPVDTHVEVRERREHRQLELEETSETTDE